MGHLKVCLHCSERTLAVAQPIFLAIVARKVMTDIAFSNGITIARGTLLSPASAGFHMDHNMHDIPEEFPPFRHVNRKAFVATSADYLPFGHARQAW